MNPQFEGIHSRVHTTACQHFTKVWEAFPATPNALRQRVYQAWERHGKYAAAIVNDCIALNNSWASAPNPIRPSFLPTAQTMIPTAPRIQTLACVSLGHLHLRTRVHRLWRRVLCPAKGPPAGDADSPGTHRDAAFSVRTARARGKPGSRRQSSATCARATHDAVSPAELVRPPGWCQATASSLRLVR